MTTMHAPHRNRLPETRPSVTRKVTICGFETYITVGFYDDRTGTEGANLPGEVFVKLSKHGSEMSGLLDTASIFLSIALQYGVPWEVLYKKMVATRFGMADEKYSSLSDGIAKNVSEIIILRAEMLGLPEPKDQTDAPSSHD